MPDVCCEMTAPIVLGDSASVITINAGGPDAVTGIVIFAEGCGCGYQENYSDTYCDVTDGGANPDAAIVDTEYEIIEIPANSTLTIDAVERTVTLTETGTDNKIGGLDVMEWAGVFEWIEASKGGCIRICIDPGVANLNPDTTVSIDEYQREL